MDISLFLVDIAPGYADVAAFSPWSEIKTAKRFLAINIRIARPVNGLAAPLLPYLLDPSGRLYHTLIVSEPRGGKTTLLRDLIRTISDGDITIPMRVGIVDERSDWLLGGEVFPSYQ